MMHTQTKMMIWFVVLLLVGSALLGACGGSTAPSTPATTVAAPTQAPLTTAPATAVPTVVEALATTAPTVESPAATVEPTQAPVEPTEAPATEQAPAIDAAALLEARCVECHSLGRTTGARYTQEQWQQVVTRMIRKGAVLNPDEEAALVAYLAETYKP